MHYADYQGSHGCPTLTNSNEWGELIELMKLNNETFKISSAPIRIQYSGVSPQGNRGNGRNDPPVVPVPLPVPPTP